MKYLLVTLFAIACCFTTIFVGCSQSAAVRNNSDQPVAVQTAAPIAPPVTSNDEYRGEKIVKTEEEWRKLLTPAAFHVLREEGTERPYSGEYNDNKESGDYHCAACGLKLFSSKTKYDSQTGWPSFYQPIFAKNVAEKPEKPGDDRIEIECARCGSHLGHVFDDGPEPTGLRYCMNSVSLKFEKAK